MGGSMRNTFLGIVLSILALPAVSARAGSVCGSAGASLGSRYCSFASPMLYLRGGENLPSFTVGRDGRALAPVLGMHLLSFDASFPGSHSGVASLVKVADSGMPSYAGRQGFGEGGNGGAYGVGTLSNFVPDGWYRRPSADGWVRFPHAGYVGSTSTGTGFTTLSAPLDPTPEPMTLLLFGSGLFLIAFLARRRTLDAREDS
jgi:hypothetical protein